MNMNIFTNPNLNRQRTTDLNQVSNIPNSRFIIIQRKAITWLVVWRSFLKIQSPNDLATNKTAQSIANLPDIQRFWISLYPKYCRYDVEITQQICHEFMHVTFSVIQTVYYSTHIPIIILKTQKANRSSLTIVKPLREIFTAFTCHN